MLSKYYIPVLFLLLGVSYSRLASQNLAFSEQHYTTFDKLQKTILEFTSTSKPAFSISPKSAESLVSMRFDKTMQSLVVEQPLSAGTYILTLKSGKKSTQATLMVLPSTLDTTSSTHRGIMPLFYGKRLAARIKLPEAASKLRLKDFSYSYQLGNEIAMVDNPFLSTRQNFESISKVVLSLPRMKIEGGFAEKL